MDIVERLRELSTWDMPELKYAADEIERLRKDAKKNAKYMLALHRIRQWNGKEFMEAFDQAVKLYEDEQPAKATGGE